jgi:RNA 3'-terminal phosphate cyclase (ATP)
MVVVDGSHGEGGGQMLRSSLSLSLWTGRPFRMIHVRSRRQPPGLRPQHLMALKAAAVVGRADISGAEVGSRELTFAPRELCPGRYRFSIGTAGNALLVLQALLPPLLVAPAPSTLTVEGGTYNPFAPPYDFIARTFLPIVSRLGPACRIAMERPGFYPRGGGLVTLHVEPCRALAPLDLVRRGEMAWRARAMVGRLPLSIAERELSVLAERLGIEPKDRHADYFENAVSPGNVALVEAESEELTLVFTAIGSRGVPAESVAGRVAEEALRYRESEGAADEHLADQLLLPLAMAGRGRYTATILSRHATTNMEVIRGFLDTRFRVRERGRAQEVSLGE